MAEQVEAKAPVISAPAEETVIAPVVAEPVSIINEKTETPVRKDVTQLLSDYAFFEGFGFSSLSDAPIAPAAAEIAPVAIVAEPVEVVKIEEVAAAPVIDILAQFRVVEWNKARNTQAAAPTITEAVAPVAETIITEAVVAETVAEVVADVPVMEAASVLAEVATTVEADETEQPEMASVDIIADIEASDDIDDAETVMDADMEEVVAPSPAELSQTAPTFARIATPAAPYQPAPLPQTAVDYVAGEYEFPPRSLLQEPPAIDGTVITQEMLERSAGLLESVLEDFGVRGEIIHVRPGPVVTLYEFEPAPGVKSSRVIGLADDIARSMSALSARVAVVPGRNVIGIELPNANRETVYFREMIESAAFQKSDYHLPLGLGKAIGGEPIIAELAKMPHLLVAGTTGSGKSVAINTMILSLLYRFKPEECRLIMVDPKMLELSIYDGIPHLLTPVVTDPKKAVVALKWAVREMEERYRKMARLGVRNIEGFNARAASAKGKGETVMCTVQSGFDKETGEPVYVQEELDLTPMPYIVVIIDEMADLMMVAGKEIEGAVQRLAQMARAAGIHLIMATQRPSVDVITGTIKANFPTRISFQVTSKIDSRTILGEMGAEQLLGQGDMLHMAGGGRIVRVHGPFVSDEEVEKVVSHLKEQGRPDYLATVTAEDDDEEPVEEDSAVFDQSSSGAEDGDEFYQQAVKVVMRDKKCSTSYIQRRLGIGYNRAASLVERMEKEGLVGAANHVGKREILAGNRDNG
ncbi:DNA translocase FtsK [Brucellaceae bacterium C25G]